MYRLLTGAPSTADSLVSSILVLVSTTDDLRIRSKKSFQPTILILKILIDNRLPSAMFVVNYPWLHPRRQTPDISYLTPQHPVLECLLLTLATFTISFIILCWTMHVSPEYFKYQLYFHCSQWKCWKINLMLKLLRLFWSVFKTATAVKIWK